VVGYSGLMAADEEGTLARLNALRAAVLDAEVAAARGRIFKSMGDGVLAEFESVADAVRAAVAVQRRIAEAARGEAAPLLLRIGVNLGDVIDEGGDLFGDGVNLAARLQAAAEPGGLAVSGAVHDSQAARALAAFLDGGEQALPGLDRPVRIWRWRPEGLPQARGAAGPTAKASIAVLPFENAGGAADQEYLADGLAEDVIAELSRSPWLSVIARSSSFAYRGADPRRAARELGVRYVLQGGVRRSGDRLRVSVQLVSGASGAQVWAERHDAAFADVFALQDEVTRRVVASLVPEIAAAEVERARRQRPDSLDAWDLYLRALPLLRSNRRESVEEAERLLERALALDPGFASALARLSSCRLKAVYHGWDDGDANAGEAFRFARRALEIDPADPFALDALASAHQIVGEHEQAAEAARRALAIDANTTAAWGTLINALAFLGRADEAVALFAESERRNPRDPDRSAQLMGLGNAHFAARRFEDAVAVARRQVAVNSSYYGSRVLLAAALAHLDRLEEARAALAEALRLNPALTVARMRRRPVLPDSALADLLISGLRKAGMPE